MASNVCLVFVFLGSMIVPYVVDGGFDIPKKINILQYFIQDFKIFIVTLFLGWERKKDNYITEREERGERERERERERELRGVRGGHTL